ncbi:MAG: hypothetical protein QNJ77_13650 [Acidimicrobiia bacterium]|nr:hypothetical protein [Acidimicrobiia bacterium]
MFRFVIAALAIVGLVSLFTGGTSAATTGAGLLLLFPLLLLAKIAFFVMLFAFVGRGFARRGPSRDWPGWDRWERPRARRGDRKSNEDDFEEWHRMAHAKEEVDSWTEDVD